MKAILAAIMCTLLSLVSVNGVVIADTAMEGAAAIEGPAIRTAGIQGFANGPSVHDQGHSSQSPRSGQPRAEDWPMFMHDIYHTGNTTSRIPTTNESLWTYDTAQQIQSSAAIVGGVVYFGSNDNNLYALWANNGTLKWKFTDNNNLDDVPGSPTVVNGKVYFYGMNKGMYCIWASNGTKIWNRTLAAPNWRNYNSPLVVNDTVYISNDLSGPATIFALNATTGATKWSKNYDGYIVSSMAYRNGKVFVGRQYGGVLCLWASNGTQVWYAHPTDDGVYSSPSVSNDKLFFTTEMGWLYAYHLSNGTKAWQYQTGAQAYSSPALAYGKVFIAGSAYYQSNGTQIWSNGFSQYSTPVVSGNRLVVLNDTKLTCQAISDGTILWEEEVTGEYASPAVSENMVVIGGNDGTMYAFSTPDVTPPNVTSNQPLHQAVGVPVDANITVTFSELMEEVVTRAAVSISPAVAGVTTWNAETMTINPTGQLLAETLYTVTVKGTAADRSGNQLDGNKDGDSDGSPRDDHVFTFTTVSMAPPNITSVQPAPGATGVEPNAQVVVTFSQPMTRLVTEGAFNIMPTTAGSFSWNAGSTTLTFVSTAKLINKGSYNVTIGHAAVSQSGKLLDGNKDGAATNNALDDFRWNFTVKDWVPPTVVSVSPLDGAVDVPVRTPITIEFSEPMAHSSTETAVASNPVIDGSKSWTGQVLTITLNDDLALDTLYTFTVGVLAQDLAGQRLDGDGDGIGGENGDEHTWSFRTVKPIIPPYIESVSPQANATGVPVRTNISMLFSKPMDRSQTEVLVTIDGILASSAGYSMSWDVLDRTLTMVPSVDLSYDSEHTVKVPGTVKSSDGIGLDGDKDGVPEGVNVDDFVWKFRTESKPVPPLPKPRILEVQPAPAATGVPVTANIVVKFSLEMNRTSVQSTLIIDPLTQVTMTWNSNGTILTVDPNSNLTYDRTYKVLVSGGALSKEGAALDGDLDNVSEGAPGDDYTWSFMTAKAPVISKPPAILITRPSNDEKVSGTIDIVGTATDPDTQPGSLTVEIMFDDSGQWIRVGPGTDWTYKWNTKEVKDGKHKFSVRAYDGGIHSQVVSREVVVKNAKPSGMGSMMTYLLLALVAVIVGSVVAAVIIMRRRKGGSAQGQVVGQQMYVPPSPPPTPPQAEPIAAPPPETPMALPVAPPPPASPPPGQPPQP